MLLDRDPAHAFMPYPAVPVPHAGKGPLSGLTFAAKDLFDVAGYPTSAGSPHMLAMSGIKTRTAPTVQKLLDSGARLVGKTITDELAFSMSGKNAHFGRSEEHTFELQSRQYLVCRLLLEKKKKRPTDAYT